MSARSLLMLGVLVTVFCSTAFSAELKVEDCYVSLLNDVEVPAQAAGVIVSLDVQLGQSVKKGELLAKIDDRQAQSQKELAEIEMESAREQAANDIRIRYAKKDADVTQAELEAMERAGKAFSRFEIRQAELQASRSKLGIEQAILEQKVLGHDERASQARLHAAENDIARCSIKAPFDGVIVEIRTEQGEWVNPGDSVIRLIQMDRLNIDGFLNVGLRDVQVRKGMEVDALVDTGAGEVKANGVVAFVGSIVEAGGDYRVRVEVANEFRNGHWILRPGLPASFTIKTGAAP